MAAKAVSSLASLCCVTAFAFVAEKVQAQGYIDPSVREQSREESQTGTVTIDADNAPIESVLKEIARQAGLTPFYSSPVKNRPLYVTVHVQNASARDAFELALRGTGLVAVLSANSVAFVETATPAAPIVARGDITGTVVDASTKASMREASVSLDGHRRLFTDADGTFTLSDVEAGEHRITIKSIGYTRQVHTVVVAGGRTATVQAKLRPNPNTTLDQVVVTGAMNGLTPVEIRRLPSAISVVTSKDLEARGITHLDQLFHGDIPGLFAQIRGSDASPGGSVQMGVRGSTRLEGGSVAWDLIKTFVDGVEMADPKWFNQIDPRSIDRIEILTGPQATTMYGSRALNGVMQIFTKRGAGSGHRLTMSLISGLIQNNVTTALTPQHDLSAQLSGSKNRIAYNVGGSVLRVGQWTPTMQSTRTNLNAGTRMTFGKVSADLTFRKTQLTNQDAGLGPFAADLRRDLMTTGFYPPTTGWYHGPRHYITRTDSRGLRVFITPTSSWSHDFSAGIDDGNFQERQDRPAYSGTWDSLTFRSLTNRRLTTMRYNTTFKVPLTSYAQIQTLLGAEKSKTAIKDVGYVVQVPQPARRTHFQTRGLYIQNQLDLRDQLFLTYGLRAEYDTTFGKHDYPNITRRYGIAYARDVDTRLGSLTFKLRGAYGQSTRPPPLSLLQNGILETSDALQELYGTYYKVLPNPTFGPEYKKGGEAGLEMSLGSRFSLVVTRYNETVDNLIYIVNGIDSVRSLLPFPWISDSQDSLDYGYIRQSQTVNAAALRNQGWELQGTGNVGPVTVSGSYTFQKSRSLGARPQYEKLLPWISRGSIIGGGTTEHTWVLRTTYNAKHSSVTFTLNGIGPLYRYDTPDLCGRRLFVGANSGCFRMFDARPIFNNGNFLAPPYILSYIDASHTFTPRIEGILQIHNAGNTYVNDRAQRIQVMGRQTNIGVRIRP